ncbi:Potassium channel subfamily T member 2 [Orchesella cincta]|uniref:Potassium channel subfamily T member 2 n=1 Tax=Orchesella cincta TaxID=48709 RepID=A0A1D2NJI8_ORCCI|nr:Potassium channel subfamily T member 2 [Orchesella cincta]
MGGDIEASRDKRDSSVGTQEPSEGDEDEKLFLRKSSSMSKRLRRTRCSLAAFSELSLSRSSFRLEQDDDRVRVEYYVNERTIKERLHMYFFKNQRSSLRIRIARFILKLFTCVLYIARVMLDDNPTFASCFGCSKSDKSEYLKSLNFTEEEYREEPVINWDAIIWVDRPLELWVVHAILAIISFSETLLLVYLNYKASGNLFQQLLTRRFGLELFATVPFVVTIFYPPFRNLFVPVFLNCWLAKYALENMFNDLHRAMQRSQSALSQQLTILSATLICLVFTSVCGVQHFQRAGHRRLDLFQSTYFVVVTFSTVGYGDFVPDIWPSQLFMVAMICIALIVLPTQFEQLAFTWMERQKLGGSYSSHRAQSERHVVVCSTSLHADTIMDFLNEFYAHPLLQDFYVVLLSPCELDTTMRMILQVPIWAQRVIYIQGSCLKDGDLTRARMGEAEACFILAARSYADKTAADEHTILRSWAVKDFAPLVPQYVQILRPENKLHVRFAEHVVCEDEFKYALLANNCLFPGTSTLVTLLLHTSRGQEGETSKEEWQRLYGKCSGNEIYHIRLGDSRFFGEYEGKSFIYASFHSHRKFGVCLVGVRPSQLPEFYEDTILLNPGPRHIMRKSDICFYLSITKEENSAFVTGNSLSPSAAAASNPAVATSPTEQSSSNNNAGGGTDKNDGGATDCGGAGDNNAVNANPTATANEHDNLIIPTTVVNRRPENSQTVSNFVTIIGDDPPQTIQIAVDHIEDRRASVSMLNSNLLMLPSSSDAQPTTQHSRLTLTQQLPVPAESKACPPSSEECSGIKGFPQYSSLHGSPNILPAQREKAIVLLATGSVIVHIPLSQTSIYPPPSTFLWACEHCANRTAYDYKWKNKTIIIAADYASTAIYNFIVPLRAHFRPKHKLNPIILLLERRPDTAFLDAASYFPMIYWFLGSIDCLDDLLRAGITLAESVVVVNKELSNSAEEETLSDCNTICAVQTMFRFFPHIKIVTELSTSSNMRFMQFRAHDTYALHLSRMEKREKERGSHISYMFRLPFAAGSVFAASMLDTLLYQAFVKDYLITFVRLLLGIDQAPGSGFLTSMQVTREDLWIRTYGRLYQKLCSTTCEIPIGIYRTQDSQSLREEDYYETEENRRGSYGDPIAVDSGTPFSSSESTFKKLSAAVQQGKLSEYKNVYKRCFRGTCGSDESSFTSAALTVHEETGGDSHAQLIERAEIANLVRSRMQSLGLPWEETELQISEKRDSLSYVIINPSCDLKIREGDVIYLIRPTPFSATKTFERHNSRRKSTLNPSAGSAGAAGGGCGGASNPEELQKAAFNLFQEHRGSCASMSRRRSSSDSPRLRANSLRVSPADDILLRRSNSLRQGLGLGLGSRRPSTSSNHDEIGLPTVSRNTLSGPPPSLRSSRLAVNGAINVEVTPPDIEIDNASTTNSSKTPTLQGTIV